MTPLLTRLRKLFALLATTALLAACGGGGSDNSGGTPPPTNPPPTNPPPTNPPPEEPDDEDETPVTPDEIAFTSLDNVAPMLDYGSEKLTLAGIPGDEPLAITVEGANCRLVINDEVIEGGSGELENEDTLRIIARAPSAPGSSGVCTIDAGSEPVQFSVTTGANNGSFHVMPGAVHTSWHNYNVAAMSGYQIRGRLAGQPETGVVLVNDLSPEINSYTFPINSLEVDWGNDQLSVWACSNLVGVGISSGYAPCQALLDVDRQLHQPLSTDAVNYFKASNTHDDMGFGGAVAMNAAGDVIAISTPYESSAATGIDGDQNDLSARYSGAVYLLRKVNGQWQQEAYMKASNTDAFDRFGFSVALNAEGDRLAVGARLENSTAIGIDGDQDDNSAQNAGAVYLFRHSGSNWVQEAYIKASNAEAGDQFGYSLALNAEGDRLAVGAPFERSNATGIDGDQTDNSISESGAVYLFENIGEAWIQTAYFKRSIATAQAHFGRSIALNAAGSVLAVGAARDDGPHNTVHVFHETGSVWTEAQRFDAPDDSAIPSGFGTSISLDDSGNLLAVAAHQYSREITHVAHGRAYLYQRAEGAWNTTPLAELEASNVHSNMTFGHAIALSSDGTRLAVAAVGESSAAVGIGGDTTVTNDCAQWALDTCASVGTGAVYLFDVSQNGVHQTHYLKPSHLNEWSWFGDGLAMNGAGDMVAARSEDHSAATGINGNPVDDCDADEPENCAEWSGAVYLFE